MQLVLAIDLTDKLPSRKVARSIKWALSHAHVWPVCLWFLEIAFIREDGLCVSVLAPQAIHTI